MNCYFLTFGCKVNTCETASMQTMLRSAGHCIVTTPEEADVCILNSCTVTESGDNRTRAALRKLRRSYPDMLLVLTGCYAQAYPEQAESIPEADLVLGTKGRSRLPELLETWQQTHTPCGAVDAYTGHDTFEALPCDIMPDNTRAFLKIQDGCNCFCSYCIIPYARGRCRSLPPEELRRAASTFAEHGYQELVLCGINLGFYGMEWGGSLADAVELCCTIPGIRRVRLSSLEPERMTDEVLDRLAALPQFCPQFHLSLQSGCDRTLRRMNRKYTAAEPVEIQMGGPIRIVRIGRNQPGRYRLVARRIPGIIAIDAVAEHHERRLPGSELLRMFGADALSQVAAQVAAATGDAVNSIAVQIQTLASAEQFAAASGLTMSNVTVSVGLVDVLYPAFTKPMSMMVVAAEL